ARAEAVIVRQGSIAKFGRLFQIRRTSIGNHDDLAFVVDQAAESDREQYCYQRDVEDQVCQLTAITTFCGNRVRTRAVFFSRKFRDTPLLQPGFYLRAHLLKAALRLALGMHLHAVSVLRRTRWWRLRRLVVIPRTRDDAAHHRNGKQYEDRAKPGGGENIEKLKLVVDFCHAHI